MARCSFGEAAFRLLGVKPSADESQPSMRPFVARMPILLPIEQKEKYVKIFIRTERTKGGWVGAF